MKLSIHARRDGYRRYGHKWTVYPQVVEIQDFNSDVKRPSPGEGARYVLSKAELADLKKYAATPNAQLLFSEPDDLQLQLAKQAEELTQLRQEREQLRAQLDDRRDAVRKAEAELSELHEQKASIEQLATQAEERAKRANEEAGRAEGRLKDAQDALQELQEQSVHRRGSRKGR